MDPGRRALRGLRHRHRLDDTYPCISPTPVGGRVRVGAEVDVLRHGELSAAQSVGVGDPQRIRVRQRGQPPFGPLGALGVDHIVHDVRKRCRSTLVGDCRADGNVSLVLCSRDRATGRPEGERTQASAHGPTARPATRRASPRPSGSRPSTLRNCDRPGTRARAPGALRPHRTCEYPSVRATLRSTCTDEPHPLGDPADSPRTLSLPLQTPAGGVRRDLASVRAHTVACPIIYIM